MKFKISTVLFAFVLALVQSVASAGIFDSLLDKMASIGAQGRLDVYAKVVDKPLVDAFYTLTEDGKKEGLATGFSAMPDAKFYQVKKLTPSSLTMKSLMYQADEMSVFWANERSYSASPMDDAMGQRYVAFATDRGNTVKQYKPRLSNVFNNAFEQFLDMKPAPNVANSFGSENALIEYSPDGRVVSFMLRSHQAIHNLTMRAYQYVTIYFGQSNGNSVENQFPNSLFAENYQRDVVAVKAPTPVPAQAPAVTVPVPAQ